MERRGLRGADRRQLIAQSKRENDKSVEKINAEPAEVSRENGDIGYA
jgi:hypothetical protein